MRREEKQIAIESEEKQGVREKKKQTASKREEETKKKKKKLNRVRVREKRGNRSTVSEKKK